uniref:Uncharacterized protein n=1 Tax=Anguilla anguilla TaxID=7936 RepID=A0A0E9QHG8_ANGAN
MLLPDGSFCHLSCTRKIFFH